MSSARTTARDEHRKSLHRSVVAQLSGAAQSLVKEGKPDFSVPKTNTLYMPPARLVLLGPRRASPDVISRSARIASPRSSANAC